MKTQFISCLLFIIFCLTSCSVGNKDAALDEKQILTAHIDSLQKKMFNPASKALDKNLASEGISAYHAFIEKYPQDTLSAEYLFRMSDLLRAAGDNNKSLECLNQISNNYPGYKKMPECIFLQGYYYQEFFNDTTKAKEYYNLLLSKYPTHPFADDAKALMSMFGKSDEEMIKEFERKAAQKK